MINQVTAAKEWNTKNFAISMDKGNMVWQADRPTWNGTAEMLSYKLMGRGEKTVDVKFETFPEYEAEAKQIKKYVNRIKKLATKSGFTVSEAVNRSVDGQIFPTHYVVTMTRN